MKKKLIAVLGALAMLVGVGAVTAPAANAASQQCSTHQGEQGNFIDTCSVWNNNYVQGRFVSYPTANGSDVIYWNLTAVYYVDGSEVYRGRIPAFGGYGPTIQIPHGSYFQVAYVNADPQVLRSPTIRVP